MMSSLSPFSLPLPQPLVLPASQPQTVNAQAMTAIRQHPAGWQRTLLVQTAQLATPLAMPLPADSYLPQPLSLQPVAPSASIQKPPLQQTDAIKRFAVIGDSGTREQPQWDIAHAMEAEFARKPFASVLMLGDNVYTHGEPEFFEASIRQPYENLRKEGVNFYPVLGNHDLNEDVGATQLRYLNMPRYYNYRLGDIELFAIDTTILAPDYRGAWFSDEQREWARQEGPKEYAWLNQALANSTAKYKVVYGHYPLVSNRMFTEPPGFVSGMYNTLMPLLAKYKVDIYLAGHNHDYEKSRPIPGLNHFVSGAGGRLEEPSVRDLISPPKPIEKLIKQNHFMIFEETPQGLTYQAIGKAGNILDQGFITPKQ